jgi:hypothetical protein
MASTEKAPPGFIQGRSDQGPTIEQSIRLALSPIVPRTVIGSPLCREVIAFSASAFAMQRECFQLSPFESVMAATLTKNDPFDTRACGL